MFFFYKYPRIIRRLPVLSKYYWFFFSVSIYTSCSFQIIIFIMFDGENYLVSFQGFFIHNFSRRAKINPFLRRWRINLNIYDGYLQLSAVHSHLICNTSSGFSSFVAFFMSYTKSVVESKVARLCALNANDVHNGICA